jgi:hypothetical protein
MPKQHKGDLMKLRWKFTEDQQARLTKLRNLAYEELDNYINIRAKHKNDDIPFTSAEFHFGLLYGKASAVAFAMCDMHLLNSKKSLKKPLKAYVRSLYKKTKRSKS